MDATGFVSQNSWLNNLFVIIGNNNKLARSLLATIHVWKISRRRSVDQQKTTRKCHGWRNRKTNAGEKIIQLQDKTQLRHRRKLTLEKAVLIMTNTTNVQNTIEPAAINTSLDLLTRLPQNSIEKVRNATATCSRQIVFSRTVNLTAGKLTFDKSLQNNLLVLVSVGFADHRE